MLSEELTDLDDEELKGLRAEVDESVRGGQGGSEKGGKADKGEKVEKGEKADKGEKGEKGEKVEKADKGVVRFCS
ncbi:hypothetical protein E4U12_001477 [Claviceps purpurea]|nr:hypothetical protein E4U12_001477 [Claviceps purpurea]